MNKFIHLFLLLCVLLCISASYAQAPVSNTSNSISYPADYAALTDFPVIECNILGQSINAIGKVLPSDNNGNQDTVDQLMVTIPQGTRFRVIGDAQLKGSYVMEVWIYSPNANNEELMKSLNFNLVTRPEINYLVGKTEKSPFYQDIINHASRYRRYFRVTSNELSINSTRYYKPTPVFALGPLLLPVKLRTTPFNFSKDFSFGASGGLRIRISHYTENYFDLLFAVAVADITVDSATTGFNGRTSTTTPTDKPAFSAAAGFAFEFGKAQLGFFTGFDALSKNDAIKSGWDYQKQPWFSVGIGLNIFSLNASSTFVEGVNRFKQHIPHSIFNRTSRPTHTLADMFPKLFTNKFNPNPNQLSVGLSASEAQNLAAAAPVKASNMVSSGLANSQAVVVSLLTTLKTAANPTKDQITTAVNAIDKLESELKTTAPNAVYTTIQEVVAAAIVATKHARLSKTQATVILADSHAADATVAASNAINNATFTGAIATEIAKLEQAKSTLTADGAVAAIVAATVNTDAGSVLTDVNSAIVNSAAAVKTAVTAPTNTIATAAKTDAAVTDTKTDEKVKPGQKFY